MPTLVKAEVIKNQGIPALDILVPSYNRLDLTTKCIRAIYANTRTPFHLIVVDHSDELTPLYLRQLEQEKPNVTVYHGEVKSGNHFFNLALERCKTPYLTTVMNSVTVEPDWETVALQLMKDDPKIGVIGFKCLFPWGLIESAGIAMNGFTPTDLGRDQPAHRLNVIYEAVAVQWAFALLRVEAVKGKLDEDMYKPHVGWDDIDNCFVVRNAGWKILYDGMGVGYHEPRATRGTNSFRGHVSNLMNAETFYKRWGYWDAYKAGTNKPVDYQGINELMEFQVVLPSLQANFENAKKALEEMEGWIKAIEENKPPPPDPEAIPVTIQQYPPYNPMMGTR